MKNPIKLSITFKSDLLFHILWQPLKGNLIELRKMYIILNLDIFLINIFKIYYLNFKS